MWRLWLVVAMLGGNEALQAQTFNAFLTRLHSLPDSLRPAVVDSFMAACPGFPYVEGDTLTHFIYRGSQSTVTVAGDANGWDPVGTPLSRISGTDFWYCTRSFEPDARLDYKFVLGGNNWILDPRNPRQCTGGFGPNSELRMPQYPDAPEVRYYADLPHGTIRDTLFTSAIMGNTRRIRIYTPPGYEGTEERYPLVLVHDGLEYISLAHADNVLNYLIARQRIHPVIAVFVPPVNRTAEYAGNLQDEFTQFIVTELLPFVDGQYRTRPDPHYRATLGASNGGNIALWLAYSHPEVFGLCASQSSNVQASIMNGFQNGPVLDVRFYLDLGTYDIAVLIPLVRNFVQVLEQRGYVYRYQEFHEGHSWCNWAAHIDNALEMFFPGDSLLPVRVREASESSELLEAYPNPFNVSFTLYFALPRGGPVELALYDATGRLVKTVLNAVYESGTHRLTVDTTGMSTGLYFVHMKSRDTRLTCKVLLLK